VGALPPLALGHAGNGLKRAYLGAFCLAVPNFTARSGEGGRGGRPRRPFLFRAVSGDPADLHGAPLLEPPVQRAVRWGHPTSTAIVLGRAQAAPAVAADLPVVRRVSAGGAVLVSPDGPAWADITIPRSDPLWDDDVGRASWWVGEVWSAALVGLGLDPASLRVHRGPMARRSLGAHVCFAGLAEGEVILDGAKIVGVSQRRTRDGALFQCAVLLEWDPDPLLSALGLPAEEWRVAALAIGLRRVLPGVSLDEIEAAFESALERYVTSS
jgi:lipoate-protein ligase A